MKAKFLLELQFNLKLETKLKPQEKVFQTNIAMTVKNVLTYFLDRYPHDRDCTWVIFAPPGKRIRFQFATLRLEHHANCSYDYLEVRHFNQGYVVCISNSQVM